MKKTCLPIWASLVAQMVKKIRLQRSKEDSLEKGTATHSSVLAWRTPWTEAPRGLQPPKVRHDWETSPFHFITCISIVATFWKYSFRLRSAPVNNLRALFYEDFRKGRQDIGEALKAGWRWQTHNPGGRRPGVSAAGSRPPHCRSFLTERQGFAGFSHCCGRGESVRRAGHHRGAYYRVPTAMLGFPGGSAVKNRLPGQEPPETWVQSLGGEDALEQETATHSSPLAWEIPWTKEPDGLPSTWSQSGTRLSSQYTQQCCQPQLGPAAKSGL